MDVWMDGLTSLTLSTASFILLLSRFSRAFKLFSSLTDIVVVVGTFCLIILVIFYSNVAKSAAIICLASWALIADFGCCFTICASKT